MWSFSIFDLVIHEILSFANSLGKLNFQTISSILNLDLNLSLKLLNPYQKCLMFQLVSLSQSRYKVRNMHVSLPFYLISTSLAPVMDILAIFENFDKISRKFNVAYKADFELEISTFVLPICSTFITSRYNQFFKKCPSLL